MPVSGHRPGSRILGGALLSVVLAGGAACSLLENRASLLGEPASGADSSPRLDLAAGRDLMVKAEFGIYPPPPDSGLCPGECINACADEICLLDCTSGCTCPKGHACQVECKGDSCHGSINCNAGKSCLINCDTNACNIPIDCGAAACTIGCFKGSCNDPILCGKGGCKITCSDRSCQNLINCERGRCDILCSGSSCKGSIACNLACACSVTCSVTSCDKSRIECLAGCKYTYATGCSDSSKYPWCNTC